MQQQKEKKEMSKSQTVDMTKGNPLPLLVKFAIPLVLGSIFQQLYSFADTAIVGRCISVDALSAVGVTGALNFLVLSGLSDHLSKLREMVKDRETRCAHGVGKQQNNNNLAFKLT